MSKPTTYYCQDTIGSYDGMFDGENVLVSAGLAWNNPGDGFTLNVPDAKSLFVDSGGFQATTGWNLRYPYNPANYFAWAESVGADYVALPDFACEPSLHYSPVRERVLRTAGLHVRAMQEYEEYGYSFTPVPVLQGYEPAHYEECARLYADYGLATDYMAIGTVCKRKGTDSIAEVLSVLEQHYPGAEWHLFGATINVYKDDRLSGRFRSTDTAAWNWGADSKEHKKELFADYKKRVESLKTDSVQRTLTHG